MRGLSVLGEVKHGIVFKSKFQNNKSNTGFLSRRKSRALGSPALFPQGLASADGQTGKKQAGLW
jgi:hypothetical protein